MSDLQSLKGNLGLGESLTEEQRQKRLTDLAAWEEREKVRVKAQQQAYWGHRLEEALKYAPPGRFCPYWADETEDAKPIMDYGATFENFRQAAQPKAYQMARDFAVGAQDSQGNRLVPGLLLVGPVGTGKSHLTAAIYNYEFQAWLDRGTKWAFKTIYTTETRLLAEVRATFKADAAESEEDVIARFCGCPQLILDDLCKYEAADPRFRNRILFEVIDGLWGNERLLVATSNYALPELTQMLGEPIADRLRDMCVVVEMKGSSQRGKAQA